MDPSFDRPEGPILRIYGLISGPADQERAWDEFTALFLPDARLRAARLQDDGSEWAQEFTPDEFAAVAAPHYRESGFWEREIARRVESFGSIAHVWSTYESRVDGPDSAPVARGINSAQLVQRDGRWRIASLIWHFASPDQAIPAEYLPHRRSNELPDGGAT